MATAKGEEFTEYRVSMNRVSMHVPSCLFRYLSHFSTLSSCFTVFWYSFLFHPAIYTTDFFCFIRYSSVYSMFYLSLFYMNTTLNAAYSQQIVATAYKKNIHTAKKVR